MTLLVVPGVVVVRHPSGPRGASYPNGDIMFSAPGPQPFNETWPYPIGQGLTVASARGSSRQPATGTVIVNLKKNGTIFIVFTFSAAHPTVPTVNIIDPVIPDNADLDLVWPASQDPTLQGCNFVIVPA